MAEPAIAFAAEPLIRESDLPVASDFSRFHPFLKGVFSQWHFTPFAIEGTRFVCAEQFMMAAKAELFGDRAVARRIMETEDPALHKRFGGQVTNFDQSRWNHWRFDIVYLAKFAQNAGAMRQLAIPAAPCWSKQIRATGTGATACKLTIPAITIRRNGREQTSSAAS